MKYVQQKKNLKEKQENMTREEIMDMLQKKTEYQVDLNNLPSQEHNWVDRGAVVSCEGAGHPNHHAYKRM